MDLCWGWKTWRCESWIKILWIVWTRCVVDKHARIHGFTTIKFRGSRLGSSHSSFPSPLRFSNLDAVFAAYTDMETYLTALWTLADRISWRCEQLWHAPYLDHSTLIVLLIAGLSTLTHCMWDTHISHKTHAHTHCIIFSCTMHSIT